MDVGERLRRWREWRGLSQGQIEEQTGVSRCHVSRLENGHTVPSLETLEKIVHALDIPLYHFLCGEGRDGAEEQQLKEDWASGGKGKRVYLRMKRAIQKMTPRDRTLLLHLATKIANRSRRVG